MKSPLIEVHRGKYVLIKRKCDEHPLYGIILKTSSQLVLVAELTDYLVDGFSVLRCKDISNIECYTDDVRFTTAVRFFGLVIPTCPELEIESMAAILQHWPKRECLSLHKEYKDPDIVFIGLPSEKQSGVSRFHLDKLDTNCDLENTEVLGIDDVTRLDFRGRYESIVFAGYLSKIGQE